MTLDVPPNALVVLVGTSGAGKSTFARRHFAPLEIVSSDHCRALVADDENDQDASEDAFALVDFIVRCRLKRGLRAVVDATSAYPEDRRKLVRLGKAKGAPVVGIVLDVPLEECLRRHAERTDRHFPADVIREQRAALDADPPSEAEGYDRLHRLSPAAIAQLAVQSRGFSTS